mmetsp:Transcript_18117/g.25344  ORF Transcript_18117/g.25344 Transcript_18117/m.25344 type:complete len:700 (+) Transcript_18117:1408-3507(+)
MNQEEKILLIQELTQEKEDHSRTIQQLQEKNALIDKLNENHNKLQKALEETQKTLLQTQKKLSEEKKKNNGSDIASVPDTDNRDSANAQQKLNFLMKGNEELKIENAKLKIQLQQADKDKEKLLLDLSALKQSLEETKKQYEEEKFNSELGNVTIDSLQKQLADLRKQQQARGIQTYDDEIERLQFNEFQQEVLGESFQAPSPMRPVKSQETPQNYEDQNPELAQLKLENTQLKEQLQEEKQNNDAAWESINSLKNDKNKLSAVIEEQSRQIEQLKQEVERKEVAQQPSVETDNSSSDVSILQLQTKLNRKEKQIQTLRATMENSAKQQQSTISALQANIRTLTEQRDALQLKLADVQTLSTTVGSNHDNEQITLLTHEKDQLRKELTELLSSNESLKQQIAQLNGELSASKQQATFLQSSLEELQNKQSQLAQVRTTEAQSLSNLQQEIENLLSRNSVLELERDKLLLQVKSVGQEMEDAIRRIRQELETEKQAHALTEKQLQQEQIREQQTSVENKSLQLRIIELEKSLALLKDASNHETDVVTDLKLQISELERNKLQLQTQVQDLNAQLEIEKKNAATLKLQIEKLTKSLEATQQQLTKVTANFEQERDSHNNDMELLRSQLNEERSRNSQLQEQIEKDKISMELASIDSLKHQIGELKKVYENDLDFDIGSMNLSLDGLTDNVTVDNSSINGGI